MHWWIIHQLGKMRQQELLKEAERVRLLRGSRSKGSKLRNPKSEGRKLESSYFCFLNKMGKLLVSWGTHLQSHCEARLK